MKEFEINGYNEMQHTLMSMNEKIQGMQQRLVTMVQGITEHYEAKIAELEAKLKTKEECREKPTMDSKEVMEYLKIKSHVTLWNYINNHKLTPIGKVGKKNIFDASEVKALVV